MAAIQMRIQSALLAASIVLSLTSVAYCDLNYYKRLNNGAVLSYDLSYDAPDYQYIGASPLGLGAGLPGIGGLYSSDLPDNYIVGGGLGLGGGFSGISALQRAASPIILQKPINNRRASFIRNSHGRRIRLVTL